jgi:hypothetical protein
MTRNPYSQAPSPQPPYTQTPAYYPPQQKRSVWPTVIGIISIILASLGLLCTPLVTITNAINPTTQQVYEYLPDWYRTWEIVGMFGGIVFAVVLLIGGITLLKRRPVGRTLHLVYAVVSFAVAVVNVVIFATIIGQTAGMPAPMRAGLIGGGVGGTCGGLIYPVFLLIWFLRAPIAEEVRTWAGE